MDSGQDAINVSRTGSHETNHTSWTANSEFEGAVCGVDGRLRDFDSIDTTIH